MTTRPRRSTAMTAGPPLHVVDFLLRQSRTPASIDRWRAFGGAYEPFFEFRADSMPVADFLELWTRCEPAIIAAATKRGIEVPDPRTYLPFPRACWITGEIDD